MKSSHVGLRTLSLLFLFAAAASTQPDKSRWPRLYPVVFVHGVNSSGKMWAMDMDETAMHQKHGEYNYYKGERETVSRSYPEGHTFTLQNFGLPYVRLSSIRQAGKSYPPIQVTDANICGESCDFETGVCTPNTCNAPQPDNVNHILSFKENPDLGPIFDFDAVDAPFVTHYDRRQFELTRQSRTFQMLNSRYFGNPAGGDYSTYGFGVLADLPPVTQRRNGMEGYTSYWHKSWADGNPPAALGSGKDGQLYGTYSANKDYAPFARYAVSCGSKWMPIEKSQWKPMYRPTTYESTCNGAYWQSYFSGGYVKSGPNSQGIITYKYKYTASSLPTLYITLEERPTGLVSDMFTEDSKFGQIGQLYTFVKKVLDRYYVGPDGRPNWMTDNGQSDPEAKVVLFGHSQGGVISRSLLYPGFSTVNTFDSDPRQNYYPMYWPAAMVGYAFRGFDNSAQTHTKWFDPRNHIAAVVTSSSPHLGSPVGFVLEGLHQTHLTSLVDRTSNKGLYSPIISGKNPWNWNLNTQTLATISTNLGPVINYLSPLTQPPANQGWHGLTEAIVKELRTTDPGKNPATMVTRNMLRYTPKNPGEGLSYWTQDGTSPPADRPCDISGQHGEVSNWQNYYRTFWQPEYDNWMRSFRLDDNNNGGAGSERYLNPNVYGTFFKWGQKLCEEQVGDFTRLTWNDDPYRLNSAYSDDAGYNPFHPASSSASPLTKRTATASTASSLPDPVKKVEECLGSVHGRSMKKVLSNPLLVPFRIWAYPAYAYERGMNCADDFKLNVNMTAAEMIHELTSSGAQGLLFHPASQFLHKLNQVGGGNSPMDRRPYPVTPDGSPIPLISVTNSLLGNQVDPDALTSSSSSDMVVPTLSQDMGVLYPDFAKAGSHVRVHFTGYSHMDIGQIVEKETGPYYKMVDGQATDYDAAANKAHHRKTKEMLANMLLGLASGQSSLILNPNGAGATKDNVVAQYTTPVYENGGEYRLQKKDEGVQGRMSRLKGMDKRLIRKPVVLPYDRSRKVFFVDQSVTVADGQELFLPAGSTLEMRAGGDIFVERGGMVTVGGTPAFASGSQSRREVAFTGARLPDLKIRFMPGALIRHPNPAARYSGRMVVVNGTSRSLISFKTHASRVEYSDADIYKKEYETSPYITLSVPAYSNFGATVYYPAVTGAINSLFD